LDDGYKDGAVEQLGKHLPAGPFKGGKYSVYEGGTRTPFITYWPGTIEPGVSNEIVCTIDLPSSFAELLKVAIPETACIDSMNVMPALLKEPDARGRESLLQQDNNGNSLGLRVGNWKLVRNKANISEPNRKYVGKVVQGGKNGKDELYDLSVDPGEKKNLAVSNPEKLVELQAKLDKIIKDGRTRK
jgi:arylsulfatase A